MSLGLDGSDSKVPIDFSITVLSGDPRSALARCPSIARRIDQAPNHIDVTELALVEDIYGRPYRLESDDAEFLAKEGSDDALMPGDIEHPTGVSHFAGVLRQSFIGWLAKIAKETGASLLLCYSHERGDHLYELARWWFGSKEELHLVSFDGSDAPQWEGMARRE